MSEKFCLKWNDFYSNVSKSFRLLRNENYLHDVTLVSDDHLKLSAHKLVLSACSDYFKDILKNNQHSHPLICLEGVSSEDMENIMDYIYNGEVQIFQENLNRFLGVAQRFKLEGLNGGKQEEYEEDMNDNKNSIDEFIPSLRETPSAEPMSDHTPISNSENKVYSTRINEPIGTIALTDNVDELVKQYLEKCPDGYRCTFCGKICTGKASKLDARRHIETHIDGLSYECSMCNKTFRSSSSLRNHKYLYHK